MLPYHCYRVAQLKDETKIEIEKKLLIQEEKKKLEQAEACPFCKVKIGSSNQSVCPACRKVLPLDRLNYSEEDIEKRCISILESKNHTVINKDVDKWVGIEKKVFGI